MYLGKEFLKLLFEKMSSLYTGNDINDQGGTQFVSEIRYFFATDEFLKHNNRTCDTKNKDDKNLFIKYVGDFVYLSDADEKNIFYTKNFSKSFGNSKDYDVGSNFFSVNVVKNSLNSNKALPFPSRHPVLLDVKSGTLNINSSAYTNISDDAYYFGGNSKKFAILFLWLNRYSKFNSTETLYNDFFKILENKYTKEFIDCMKWKSNDLKDEILNLVKNIDVSETQVFLTKDDMQFFENSSADNFSSFSNAYIKNSTQQTPSQIIYYGVPGSGKSHAIDTKIEKLSDEQKIRVVFHPDYTNADFIGQILPTIVEDGKTGGVSYKFKAGPFTRILVNAWSNPEKPYYLIIEEINRGNAAAIFGDIFQLLDRDENGYSKYTIMNDDINYEIRKTAPQLNFTSNTGIRLPPNLSLLATMNTSDQNVFTLDNAFQRRWDMKLVPNTLDIASAQYNAKIADSRISWGIFREFINEQISKKSVGTGLSSMEDKRLGGWFVKASGNIAKEVFANKVLKYLYDDAFKFSRQEIFAEYDNFETLHSDFVGKNGNDRFSIFTDEIKNALFDEASKDTHQDVTSDETGQDAPNGDNADAS